MKSRLHRTSDYYYYRGSRLTPVILFAAVTSISALSALYGGINKLNEYTLDQLKTPITIERVQAKEEVKEVVILSELDQIKLYIKQVFGEKGEEALKIATCESQLDPSRVGDQHLMSFDEKWQEMKGDSVGILQIRTGGEGWNRARANGMSTDEFRVKLKGFKYNIDYAKTIYDKAGDWSHWYHCSVKVGLN